MYIIFHYVLQALDKAKEAGRKERLLCKQRDQASLNEQINLDLTYSVSALCNMSLFLICTYIYHMYVSITHNYAVRVTTMLHAYRIYLVRRHTSNSYHI